MMHEHKATAQPSCHSGVGIFSTDRHGCLTMVGAGARRYFTECPKNLAGDSALERLADARLSQAFAEAQTTLEQGEDSHLELIPWNNDGQVSTLRFHADKVIDQTGNLIGYSFACTTEPVNNHSEFEDTMLSNLMQNSQDLIYFKDLNSQFTLVSDSMVERLGAASVADLLGKSDFDFWDKRCAQGFFDAEQEIIRTRKPVINKAELEARADGKQTWALTSKMALIDRNNNVIGTYGISKDITDHKETEEELELTHKKLVTASREAGMAEVATNVIHNVGNVLNSINVSIAQTLNIAQGLKLDNLKEVANILTKHADEQTFLTENEKGKRIPEYLSLMSEELSNDISTIKSELKSTQAHLQHVKTIVSMQQEYATVNRIIEQADLADVLDDAIKMSSGSLERHRITLVREFEPGILLMLDKHRVMQILINLIRNAKHAVQEVELDERAIKVAVTQPSDQLVAIEITDNGIGISPENMVNLFNHGFSTKSKGHGFGLHSGANSAKELGGSLTAQSDGLGKGATFTLALPLQPIDDSTAVALAPILHTDVETMLLGGETQMV